MHAADVRRKRGARGNTTEAKSKPGTSKKEATMQSQVQYPRQAPLLLHALARNWWLLLIRGLCAIAFGFLAFAWPGITLFTLVLLYGAYALADGILAVIAAFKDGTADSRWWLAI